jgi:hypothetical protein
MTTDPHLKLRNTMRAKGHSDSMINECVAAVERDWAKNAARRAEASGVDLDAVAAARAVGQGRRRMREMQAGRL